MSNSPLACYTKPSPNRTRGRTHDIDTVSIHCMAGNMSVESCGAWMAQKSTGASSNYGIGSDGRIGLYVDEADRSWCTSNAENDNRAVTIEVANNGGAPDWPVSDRAYAALLDLLVDICQRNGMKKLLWRADKNLIGQIDKQNMTVHRWFAAKACPGDYLYNRHYAIAAEVNRRLDEITIQEDDMDQEKFNQMFRTAMGEYRKELRDNDSGEWSEEARRFAVEQGIFAGSGTAPDGQPNYMWEDLLTREQCAQVLYRFAQKCGLA